MNYEIARNFGKNLRLAREASGYTQAELAREIHMSSESMISYYEHGRKLPSLDALIALAEALEVTPDVLLGYQKQPKAVNNPAVSAYQRSKKTSKDIVLLLMRLDAEKKEKR